VIAERLRDAYETLFTELAGGGFGAPPPGEWSAELVVAHVATNDGLLAEATEAVLAGDARPYYNHDAVDTPALESAVASRGGDLTVLAQWARTSADRLCELAERLGLGASGETMVQFHVEDGGEVVVDRPLPWATVLDIHATVHLPSHTDQLRALRG